MTINRRAQDGSGGPGRGARPVAGDTVAATRLATAPAWATRLWENRAWLAVGLIVIFSISIRLRLREVPLERDEGEYAYAGQLILHGVPPYKLVYNMKFPGTYAAYALMMGVFGQTPAGIHTGLAVVNALSILLMFMLSRRWLDDVGAVSATGVFALMSLNPALLGLAGHATHFVVLAALGGLLLALRDVNRGKRAVIFASGLLFGMATLMKQHGILFAGFAGLYLGWTRLAWDGAARPAADERRRTAGRPYRRRLDWPAALKETSVFSGGVVVPFAITCLVLWISGVFPDFLFWTIAYAWKYVSSVPMSEAPAYLRLGVGTVFGSAPALWILAAFGALTMWWDPRVSGTRGLLTALTLFSIAALSAGFYFREHYFILLLPAMGLLGGAAVSRAVYLLRNDRSIELFLAIPILLLLIVGLGALVVFSSPAWFAPSPMVASQRIYGTTLFSEAAKAGEYIAANAPPNATIGVMGSEPEIYFLARRPAVTGQIYMYPLMETHPYASRMQERLIHDIESRSPDYVVYVDDQYSWLSRQNSQKNIFKWWGDFWTARYDVIRSLEVVTEATDESKNLQESGDLRARVPSFVLILKRKPKG